MQCSVLFDCIMEQTVNSGTLDRCVGSPFILMPVPNPPANQLCGTQSLYNCLIHPPNHCVITVLLSFSCTVHTMKMVILSYDSFVKMLMLNVKQNVNAIFSHTLHMMLSWMLLWPNPRDPKAHKQIAEMLIDSHQNNSIKIPIQTTFKFTFYVSHTSQCTHQMTRGIDGHTYTGNNTSASVHTN